MANQFDNLHSAEAESAVLGSLLLDNAIYDDVAGILKPADFYLSAHQMLYRQISDLLEDGKPVDILTLEQHLHQQGLLSQAGGLAYIAQLAQNTPSTANANTYAEIVALHSKHRQLQLLGQHIVRETHSTKTADKLEELVEDIDKRFTDFTLRHQNESLDWKQAMKKVLARMTESTANKV